MVDLIKHRTALIEARKSMELMDQSLGGYITTELDTWKQEQVTKKDMNRE